MKIPKFLKRKRNIWIIVILILVVLGGYFIFGRGKGNNSIQTASVTKQNLQETVLATGQVVSGTDLDLSFQGGGITRRVYVKEGDKVSAGDVLASLDTSTARASLTTAQGSFLQAQANYEKLIAGAAAESVQTAQDAVTSAKQNLNNAYSGAINTLNNSHAAAYNAYNNLITMQNTYFSAQDQAGVTVSSARNDLNTNMQNIQSYLDKAKASSSEGDVDLAILQTISSLNNIYNDVNIVRQQCDQGIYYLSVSSADKASLDSQKSAISASLTSITSLQQNIASLKIAYQTAQDQLGLVKAPPTQPEIDAAKAQMVSAQGQVDSAQATLNNLILTAPASGTITQIDIKVGEQATSMKEVMILQNINDLHAEADVSEANIASLQVGQAVDYTFDALGPDQHFAGKVLTVNPASTVISGVVDYLVKGSLDNVPGLKPGMTANMTIMVAQKNNVLAVPSTAVIDKNNKHYVRVIDDQKKLTYHEVQIQEGLQADGGLIEIVSGLSDGQKIITYMK